MKKENKEEGKLNKTTSSKQEVSHTLLASSLARAGSVLKKFFNHLLWMNKRKWRMKTVRLEPQRPCRSAIRFARSTALVSNNDSFCAGPSAGSRDKASFLSESSG